MITALPQAFRRAVQHRSRWMLLVLASLVLTSGAAAPPPQAAAAPSGLTADDWAAISSQLPLSLTQQAYLKAAPVGAEDWFGTSVAISGNTVVVGAPSEDSNGSGPADNSAPYSGAAYVFVRDNGAWTQQAFLKSPNITTNAAFGRGVAIDGDTIVVGAEGESLNNGANTGAAYVFIRSGASWTQQASLRPDSLDLLWNSSFGHSVAIDGATIVVGAVNENSNAIGVNGAVTGYSFNSGAAFIFVRTETTWSQQAHLKASNREQDDHFGENVVVDGDTVVVGAFSEDSAATTVNGDQFDNSAPFAGAAYVFVRDGATWSQQAYLKSSNLNAGDLFGFSLALEGDRLLVGAPFEAGAATGIDGDQSDNSAGGAGAAYLFQRVGGVWSQQTYFKASNTEVGDWFGWSVALAGDTIAIGANHEASNAIGLDGVQTDNSAADAGAAYVFTHAENIWSQQHYVKASNTSSGDLFGFHLALSDTILAIGAYSQFNDTDLGGGAVYVFADESTETGQRVYLPLISN